MMLKPEMEPGKQYPVFYYHYSGPGPQIVDTWLGRGSGSGGGR